MGVASSTPETTIPQITVDELQMLLTSTHYSEDEIHQLYLQFISEVPSGVVPRSTFDVLAAALGVTDNVLATLLFNAFDANGDGMITFHEFIRGMSAMTRGTTEEKLHFSFRMYDIHRVGYLSYDVVLSLADALFGAFKAPGETPTAAQQVDAMFARTNGKLTFAGYKEYALANPAVVKGLALAPPAAH